MNDPRRPPGSGTGRDAKAGAGRRHAPPGGQPHEHATARFQEGGALLQGGRAGEAAEVLEEAADLFAGLPHQQARARNLLGAALRMDGRLDGAAAAFEAALAGFEAEGQALEAAASAYNLGLVQAQTGDHGAARDSFEAARERFNGMGATVQAAAAGRELGAALLAIGEPERAVEVMRSAVDASAGAGDRVGQAAGANTLGLALLAGGRTAEAIEALRSATGAHPRGVRPGGYAMAKANLALAYEAHGDHPRARLAAAQAAGTPGADAPVRAQAEAVLDRLGRNEGDLAAVLDDEPPERWLAVTGEELARLVDADDGERRRSAAGWIQGQLDRPGQGPERAESWLGALLELPPPAMEQLIRTTLEALAAREEDDRQSFRSQTSQAMGRFNVPQWMRLQSFFSRAAEDLGLGGRWG